MNKISLVIIVEDSHEYLPGLFQSIGKFMFSENLEIIIIDNSKTDSVAEMMNQFAVSKTYRFTKPTFYKGVLYNKGLELATNPYVVFAHSDICFMSDFFLKLFQYIESGESFDVLFFNQYYADLSRYGHDQLGIVNNQLVYRQLFMDIPTMATHIIEGTESCFLLNLNSLKTVKFSEEFHQALYEFDLFLSLFVSDKALITLESCEYIHYFIELHEKTKYQYLDSAIFAYRNPQIYQLKISQEETLKATRILSAEILETKKRIEEQLVIQEGLELALSEHKCIKEEIESALNLKNIEIENHKQRIEQLAESEMELIQIRASRGWRLLLCLYKIQDRLIPLNSRRRFFVKLTSKCIKNPSYYFRALNLNNLRKLKSYIQTEDFHRMNDRLEGFDEKGKMVEAGSLSILEPCTHYEIIEFPVAELPEVSIIIPVYNQWAFTYNCLKAILENTKNVSYEIIIADDVSSDETIHIQQHIRNITVIRNTENKGFLLNCNNAASHAKGRFIHFLNNDTNVQPNWLSSLLTLIKSDERIGMAGSKLVYKNGKLQEAGGIIWSDGSGWNYGRLDDPEKPEYNYIKEADYISGASIMIKKSLWEMIGGFDERFTPAYYEDADLAFAVRKHGYKVLYQPRSVVVHFEGISHGTDLNQGMKKNQIINQNKFVEKWRQELGLNHYKSGENVFVARDRSRKQKTILVIDHYVPHYDKDAGSKCVFMYLGLLKKMGYNVVFVGDNFYRHEPYTSTLQKMGIEVLYGEYYAKNFDKWLNINGKHINFALVNRPHVAQKYIDAIKNSTKGEVIYFGIDLHFLREERQYALTQNPKRLESSKRWKEIEMELLRKTDWALTVSSDEKVVMLDITQKDNVEVLPIFYFERFDCSNYIPEERKDLIFIGGFSHSPNEDGIIWFVNEVFPLILELNPSVKIHIVGSNPPQTVKDLKNNHIIVHGYVSDEELEELYQNARIAIMPLRFGAGVKGKTIEAMYHKVPIVSTHIGIEGLEGIEEIVTSSDTGVDFANRVNELYEDLEKLKKASDSYEAYLKQHFSESAAMKVVTKVFSS